MRNSVICSVGVLILVGCSATEPYLLSTEPVDTMAIATVREQYVRAHPELSDTLKIAIQAGATEVGMTKEQVTASNAGEPPDRILTAELHPPEDEVWFYRGAPSNAYCAFHEGRLIRCWNGGSLEREGYPGDAGLNKNGQK